MSGAVMCPECAACRCGRAAHDADEIRSLRARVAEVLGEASAERSRRFDAERDCGQTKADAERLTRELSESRKCEEITSRNLADLSKRLADADDWSQSQAMRALIMERDAARVEVARYRTAWVRAEGALNDVRRKTTAAEAEAEVMRLTKERDDAETARLDWLGASRRMAEKAIAAEADVKWWRDEAYRQESFKEAAEARVGVLEGAIREAVRAGDPSLGAANHSWYAEHGMLCNEPRQVGACDCGWVACVMAFARLRSALGGGEGSP